jgi:hypothetical protein
MDDYNVYKKIPEKVDRAIQLSNKIATYVRELLIKELDDLTFDGDDDYHRLFSIIVAHIILVPIEKELTNKERDDYIKDMMGEINRFISLHEEVRLTEPTMH